MDCFEFNESIPKENSDITEFLMDDKCSKEDNLTENTQISDKDLKPDFSNFDDLEILNNSNDDGFSHSRVMGCLSLSASDMNDDQALPLYDPFMEYESKSSYDTDVLDSNAIPGVCGLRNLGNTCFMNAGLQCLINNKIFKNYFCDEYHENVINGTLSSKFAEIIKKVWSGKYSIIHLGEFKESFGSLHVQFKNFRQHDCQEFLALLLDTMHEELNIANKSKLNKLLDEKEKHCVLNENEGFTQNKLENNIQHDSNKIINDSEQNESQDKICNTSLSSLIINKLKTNLSTDRNPNNIKELKNCNATAKKKITNELEDGIYESNTEKMADLLINNNKLDKILNKNELKLPNKAINENSNYNNNMKNQVVQNLHENKIEKNELANKFNSEKKIPTIDDFIKDTKTLNTNVLVFDDTNNLYKFDSEKFPKHESNRLQETVDNLGQIVDFGSKQGGLKRVKITNIIHEKHKIIDNIELAASCSTLHKRLKIDNVDMSMDAAFLEQDEIDTEQILCDEYSEESSHSSEMFSLNSEHRFFPFAEEIRRAYNHWDQYKLLNQSVIVNTFHGQFRSSVMCSQCSHVSITYEPFMYLPVFLPHALERQIVITFVQNNGTPPIRYLVNVNKYDRVHKIREALQNLFDVSSEEIILAEVFEKHVSKILDENLPIQRVNDNSRLIYAFEVGKKYEHNLAHSLSSPLDYNEGKEEIDEFRTVSNLFNPSTSFDLDCIKNCDSFEMQINSNSSLKKNGAITLASNFMVNSTLNADAISQEVPDDFLDEQNKSLWHSCAICLEELADFNLLFHPSCECILCNTCIEVSCKHYGSDRFICPVCGASVSPTEDFVALNKRGDYKFKVSTIPIPIVIRNDLIEEGTLRDKTLVGHPGLLKLPSSLPASKLYEHVDNAIPFLSTTYSLLFVDGQGKNCSRCLYTEHCSGCEIARTGDIKLHPGDSLAIRYTDLPQESLDSASFVSEHKSMKDIRQKTDLNIYDCLEYFSERESLDEDSPWFCPVCQQNQQATKSLSVWKFPEVLIICLKRFVFHDFLSMKVEDKVSYPLEGLNLASFASGPFSGELMYDLQACVCHFGGLSAGHYTSYSKHALTNEWYYYNDENVKKEAPNTDDCVNEYILFYQKR